MLRSILERILGRKKEEEVLEVSLEELAVMWTGERREEKREEGKKEERKEKRPQAEEKEKSSVPFPAVYRELVEPYKKIFESQNALDGTVAILDLLDRYGGCPSVVTRLKEKDSEATEIGTIAHILERVTLRDHSARVGKLMVKYLKETNRDYELLIPKFVVAGLGHDIGKIPEIRESGLYTTGDHALISADKLMEIFGEKEPPWLGEVLEAVRTHHHRAQSSLAYYLRLADGRARMFEVASVTKEFQVKEWDEWFSVEEFLDELEPHINAFQTSQGWKAFSFGEAVYCHPDLLYEVAASYARKKKVIDIRLVRLEDMEAVLRESIIPSLRSAGALFDEIPEGKYVRKYEIRYRVSMPKAKKYHYLVAIKLSCFRNPERIKEKREGIPELISSVNPA